MARIVRDDYTAEVTLAAAANPGDILETDDGRFGIVTGAPKLTGEKATLQTRGEIEIENAAVAHTAGNQAGFTLSTQKAAAADGGDGNIGRVLVDASSGQNVRVLLNEA